MAARSKPGVFQTTLPGSEVPLYLIAERSLFDRPNIYGYDDDPYRFAFFSRAALELTAHLGWRPDVVHAHDWHAAPAVMWLDTVGRGDERFRGIATVFTIHNLAHQGRSSRRAARYLGVDVPPLLEESGWDEINFMARGIFHATLDQHREPDLRARDHDARGRKRARPAAARAPSRRPRDPERPRRRRVEPGHRHEAGSQLRRGAARSALGEQARAAGAAGAAARRADVPLVAMVTRLDAQKGMEITGHVIHLLMSGLAGEAQFVVLGNRGEDVRRRLRAPGRLPLRARWRRS